MSQQEAIRDRLRVCNPAEESLFLATDQNGMTRTKLWVAFETESNLGSVSTPSDSMCSITVFVDHTQHT